MDKPIDTPELRKRRRVAYERGEYTFSAPPVCTAFWDTESWANFVRFTDTSLTGFLPYTKNRS